MTHEFLSKKNPVKLQESKIWLRYKRLPRGSVDRVMLGRFVWEGWHSDLLFDKG